MKTDWPPLSEFQFVSGRPANEDDVKDGRAVFVAKSGDVYVGKPVAIPLPQYAYHIDEDTQEKTPCVVIQAEEAGGNTMAGAVYIDTRTHLAALMREFELLGQEIPDK